MKSRNPSKPKSDSKISLLESNLFMKLSEIKKQEEKVRDRSFKTIESQNDSLTQLISKAKNITVSQQDKITLAKKNKVFSSKQQNFGTFLTGTGQYIESQEISSTLSTKETEVEEEQDILKCLHDNHSRSHDDLEQLRKMIKETSLNLKSYKKKVYQVKNDILNYAQKINIKKTVVKEMNDVRLMKFA